MLPTANHGFWLSEVFVLSMTHNAAPLIGKFNSKFGCKYNVFLPMSANYLPENVIFIPNQWANLRLAATKTMPHKAKSRNSTALVVSQMLHTPYAE